MIIKLEFILEEGHFFKCVYMHLLILQIQVREKRKSYFPDITPELSEFEKKVVVNFFFRLV